MYFSFRVSLPLWRYLLPQPPPEKIVYDKIDKRTTYTHYVHDSKHISKLYLGAVCSSSGLLQTSWCPNGAPLLRQDSALRMHRHCQEVNTHSSLRIGGGHVVTRIGSCRQRSHSGAVATTSFPKAISRGKPRHNVVIPVEAAWPKTHPEGSEGCCTSCVQPRLWACLITISRTARPWPVEGGA